MTDDDCTTLRRHLASVRNREDTTSGLARVLGNEDNRHRAGTHIRHLEQNGELVPGRLGQRRTNRERYIVPRRGRESWHHLLSPGEDRELGAQLLHEWLEDTRFILEAVPLGRPSRRRTQPPDPSRLSYDREIPCAPKGAESWGDYERRLANTRLEVATTADGTVLQRELVRVLRSETAKAR